jgi:flagellar basal body rod protein FlgG
MTNEEFERRMEFILEQQAQFASDIQQLREGIHQLREAQVQTDQVVNRLAAVTLEGFKDVNAKLDALVDSHLRMAEAQTKLSETQAHTEETIRTLIAVVDRYFTNGRN